MDLNGKKVLVLGLGETGLSMAQWVTRQGAAVRVADTRERPPALDTLTATVPGAEIVTGPFTPGLADGIDEIAVSPGVPLSEAVVAEPAKQGVPVVGDIELFAQALAANPRPKVIAITGTNGKSTVTALASRIRRVRAAAAASSTAGAEAT